MAETIALPTAAEAMRIAVNRTAKKSKTIVVDDNQKLALVVLKLHADVTSGDYASLGSQITAITGITGVNLVIDGQSRETVAAGYEQVVVTEVHLRTREIATPE